MNGFRAALAATLASLIGVAHAGAPSRTYVEIAVPGAAPGTTEAFSGNDLGDVCGRYSDKNGTVHGFIRHGDRYRTVDVPGATFTAPRRINNAGDLAGRYLDANGASHGFFWHAGNTSLRGINLVGDIAGLSANADDTVESGLVIVRGRQYKLNVPGAHDTNLYSVTFRHDVVGTWFDADQNSHGFMLRAH